MLIARTLRHATALVLIAAILLSGCAGQDAALAPTTGPTVGDRATAVATSAAPQATEPAAASAPTAAPTLAPTDTPQAVAASHAIVAAPTTLNQALRGGYYDQAITLWQADPADLGKEASLALDIAHAYLAEQRPYDAIALLVDLADDTDDADIQAAALGLLGGTYADIGDWPSSIEAYRRHLATTQAVAPLVLVRVAKAYQAAGDDQGALAVLDSIDLDALSAGDRAGVIEDKAELLRKSRQYKAALSAYDEILSFAQQEGYRALVQHYVAQTLVEDDRLEEALDAWRAILRDAPESFSAILALDALDMHGATELSDLERAEILLSAKRYDAAESALQAHIYAHTDESLARAHLLLGNIYTAQDRYQEAFAAYDLVIEEYPESPEAGDAWMAKAAASRANGGDPSGLYYEFARLYPEHDMADDALWSAALYLERQQIWAQAGPYYAVLVQRYPDSEHAQEAAFRQGLMQYAIGRYTEARASWEAEPADEASDDDRARWLLWRGLANDKAGGDPRSAWQAAYSAGPLTYYGLRALSLANEIDGPQEGHDVEITEIAFTQQDWDEVTAWVSNWHTGTLTAEAIAEIDETSDAALLMERMGWHAEAMRSMRELYDAFKPDPLAEIYISRLCLENGWYSPMILAANRARWLGQQADADDAPDALWRLSYPVVHRELIEQYVTHYDLDPLLLLALMRQESRLDAKAVSYAGAQGLAQVMPDTGEWIAERLGEEGYRTAWLERPHVSISYGAWFLRWLLDLYDGDVVAALVAYNAGPGNVNRWTNEQPIADHDLFIETLPLQQPQDYVTWITIQLEMYQRLYTQP